MAYFKTGIQNKIYTDLQCRSYLVKQIVVLLYLIMLVVIHYCFVTFGASRFWMYVFLF